MDYDPSDKKPGRGGLMDLPLGSDAPRGKQPSPDRPADKAPPPRRPGDLAGHATTPRHQRRRAPSGRPRRRLWPLWLVVALVAAGAAYWFFLRPPEAEASVTMLDFEAVRVGREGEEIAFEITNRGRRPLIVEGIRIGGMAEQDFAVVGDECTGASLGAEQHCGLRVVFTPQEAGSRAAGIEVTSNAPGEPLGIPLAGTGLAPSLTTDVDKVAFGRIAVGKASGATVVSLINTGSAPMAIARMSIEGSGESSFIWVANACSGETLEAGGSCAVRIAFQPRSTGDFRSELRIWSDAPEDPRVPLSGLGVAPGLFLRPSEIDFGELRPGEQTSAQSVRMENTGNAPLVISRIELTGDGRSSFEIVSDSCDGKTLEGDVTCTVEVLYKPTSPARHRAAMRVRAPGLRRTPEVALTGEALAPRIAVSETEVDFGQVVQYGTNERSVKVTNSGSATLELDATDLEGGGGAFGIRGQGCPGELPPGGGCDLELRFSPSRVGATESRLVIRHNAAGSPLIIDLTGVAGALPKAAVSVEPGEIRFGALAIGERSDILTVKVRSTGNARLSLGGAEISGSEKADFRIVPASCQGLDSLLPDSNCTIGIRFRPQATGGRRARLVIPHGAGGPPVEVELIGEGY